MCITTNVRRIMQTRKKANARKMIFTALEIDHKQLDD
jgi:hypothetical protein